MAVSGMRGAPADTDAQIASCQKLARTNPNNLRFQNTLAGAYIQKMRETTDFSYIDRASRIIDRVLSIEPRDYEALRLRSEIALERHQFAEVAGFSRQMIRITPDDAWNWGTLGDALMELGQYEGVAEAYQKMVSIRPNQSSYNRASYYRWVMGDAEGAIAIMQQAIAAGSGSPENTAWCFVDLGNMLFKTGRLARAADAYKAALHIFRGYYPAYAGLGRVTAAQGNIEQAIDNFKQAQAAVPMPEYAEALAELYSRIGKKAEASRQTQLIVVVDKMARANSEKTNRNLALVFADQGWNLERALELAEAELQVRNDVYTFDALAWTLFKNGKLAEAAEAARKALQFKTPEPAFFYHAGMIANALGNTAEARKHLEQALALNPRFDVRQSEIAEDLLRAIHN